MIGKHTRTSKANGISPPTVELSVARVDVDPGDLLTRPHSRSDCDPLAGTPPAMCYTTTALPLLAESFAGCTRTAPRCRLPRCNDPAIFPLHLCTAGTLTTRRSAIAPSRSLRTIVRTIVPGILAGARSGIARSISEPGKGGYVYISINLLRSIAAILPS